MDNFNDFLITQTILKRFLKIADITLSRNELVHPREVKALRAHDITLGTDNGIGKTSISRGQYVALFGKDIYGVKLDALANDEINGGFFAQVGFTTRGQDYIVQRFVDWVPTEGEPSMDDSEKVTKQTGVRFYLVKDHTLHTLRGGSDKETQKMIESIIGITADTAKAIFMTPQGEKSPLLEAAPAKTQEILMELFPLEFVDEAKASVDAILKEHEKSMTEMKTSLDKLTTEGNTRQEEVSNLETRSFDFRKQITQEVEDLRKEFVEKKKKRDELNSQIEKSGVTAEVRKEYAALNEQLVAVANNPRLKEIPGLITEKQNQWRELSKKLNTDKDSARTLETNVKVLKSEIVLADKTKTVSELELVTKAITENPEKIKAADARKAAIKAELTSNSTARAQLEVANKELADAKSNLSKMVELNPQLGSLAPMDAAAIKTQLEVVVRDNNLSRVRVESLNGDLAQLNKEIKVITDANPDLATATAREVSVLESEIVLSKSVVDDGKREVTLKAALITLKKSEITNLTNTDVCHACKRPFDQSHDHKEQNEKTLKIAEQELASLQAFVTETNVKIQVAQSTLTKLNEELVTAKVLSGLRVLQQKAADTSKALAATSVNEDLEVKTKGELRLAEQIDAYQSLVSKEKSAADSIASNKYDTELDGRLHAESAELSAIKTMEKLNEEKEALAKKVSSIELKEQDLLKSEQDLNAALKSVEDMTAELAVITDSGKALSAEQTALEAAKVEQEAKLKSEIEGLKVKIEAADVLVTEAESLHKEMTDIDNKAKDKKAQKDPYAELLVSANKAIEDIKARSKDLADRLIEADILLDMYKFWIEGFGSKGIKSFVVDDTIVVINQRIKDKLAKFGFDGVMSLEFVPEVVTGTGSIKNEIRKVFRLNGREKHWHSFSGGQKARFIFATNMAIREVAEERVGIIFHNPFYDEPFDGLCTTSQQIAMRLLLDAAKDHSGVTIVTHDAGLQAMCNRTIYLLKKGHWSHKVSKETFESPSTFNPPQPKRFEDKVRKKKNTASAPEEVAS